MNQIDSNFYISGLDGAEDHAQFEAEGITAVVKLTHTAPETGYPDAVTVVDQPLIDGPQCDFEAFRDAVDQLAQLLLADETVLVHCSAGTSRSGAVAAGALAQIADVQVSAALETIQTRKPDVEPHPALLTHARRVCNE